MTGFIDTLFLVLIATFISAHQHLTCPSTDCFCMETGDDLQIHCPKTGNNQDQIVIHVLPESRSVEYQCEQNSSENNHEIVPEIELDGEYELTITSCSLANDKSVASYIKKIKMQIIKKLNFVSGGRNTNTSIVKQHFDGLEDVEEMVISGKMNEIETLSADLFSEMPKLKKLTIKNMKNIFLPKNIFEPLKNLEYLELAHLSLLSLDPAFFENKKNLKVLNSWGNSLIHLRNDTFNGLAMLEKLGISEMESIDPTLLSEVTSLKDISLSSNKFESIPDGLLHAHKNLTIFKLVLQKDVIDALPNDFFTNLPNLKEIHMKCNLKTLSENILKGSDGIESIDLSGNQIGELPKNLLINKTALTTCTVANNLISEIPEYLFSDTSSLTQLNLSGNKITVISDKAFSKLSQLKSLRLGDNQIEFIAPNTFGALSSIENLELQNNRLTLARIVNTLGGPVRFVSTHFQGLSTLKYLNLANNSIDTIFHPYTLENLEELILNNNKFTAINISELLSIAHKTLVIDLSYNQIRTVIFPENFPDRINPYKINLSNNPINCDCKILDFVRYLKRGSSQERDNKIMITNLKNTTCSGPEHLENQVVADVDKLKLFCDLDTKASGVKLCPHNCRCLRRLEDNTLEMNCAVITNHTIFPNAREDQFKNIELTVENRSLEILPSIESCGGYKDTTKLFLGGNKISRITLENLPPHLTRLNLENNKLTTLDESVIIFLGNLTQLTNLTLSLDGNPWSCECENLKFLTFVQSHARSIMDYKNLQCADGKSLISLKPGDFCIIEPTSDLYIYLSIVTAVLGVVLGGLAACYYKYQKQIKMWLYAHNLCLWFVTEEELDEGRIYDAFVSYSHHDEDFIADFILPELENGSVPYRLCFHERDWTPGVEIGVQISNSVNDAKRTIIVMSSHYLQSNWSQHEFRVAQAQEVTERRSRIIVILYGDIGDINKLEPDIRDYLKLNTYVKWGDKWFWEKLKYAMPHVPCKAEKNLSPNQDHHRLVQMG